MRSHRIRIALTALGALAFAFTQVSPASAFIRITRANASGTGVVQAHWLDSAIPVRTIVDPNNNDIDPALAMSVIQTAAQSWNDVNTSYAVLNAIAYDPAAGHLAPSLAFDGQNSIFFDRTGANFPPGTGIIEFVRSFIELNDGHTLDADMVANDRDFFWSTTSPNLTPAPPGQSSVDMQAVVTHEYGHVLGLDHTSVANCTMIPFIIGDTRQRSLELDDRTGSSVIYPESAARGLSPGAVDFPATTGTVTGTVVSGYNGSAIFGAHVEAFNLADPSPANEISAISGELTVRNGQGDFTIYGLPPGTYAIAIIPLDGIHTIAADPNVGGIFNGIDINFEPEFWNGAGESGNGFSDNANDFTPVAVSAGANSGGVAFITNTLPGRVEIAQYGQFENFVTFRNTGFLVKRFDLPFATPFNVNKVTFPSFTFDGAPATFPSVRLCELNPATGAPNLSAPLLQINNYAGSPNGVNDIPVNITINDPDKVLFWAIQFPAQGPGFPANFPFIRMDFTNLERGLFANDLNLSLAGAGGTLVDRNLAISLTAQMGAPEQAPIVAVANLGTNQTVDAYNFSLSNPPNVRSDGFASTGLNHVNLVRRLPSGTLGLEGSTLTDGKIARATNDTTNVFPGGPQLWFVQAVDNAGNKSLTSNVTITKFGEDADEPNGKRAADQAKVLANPTTNRPESYAPAGDQDYYMVTARAGDQLIATANSTGQDTRNDQDLVMFVMETNGDVIAFDDDSNGNLNPRVAITIPFKKDQPKKNPPLRKLFILVTDIQGSALIPSGTPQVRVPSTYNLSANVQAAPALAGRAGSILEGGFAFKNTGPNPANPRAKMIYVLPANGGAGYGVKLRIYDVNGRLVRSLVDRQLPAGPHVAVWDGTDDAGRGVSSGHYYARIDAGTYSEKVGVTILK
jgi:hypothetical protein